MTRRLLIFLFALWGSCVYAQTSNVTATITDSDGTVWANGSFSVTFVPPVGNSTPPVWNGVLMTNAQKGPYVGTMNGSGAMAVALPDNSFISPPGSQWAFTLCPLATAKCTIITIPVVGASPNFTTTFSNAVLPPRFSATGVGAYGYADVEISVVPVPGGQYYNVTSACMRIWSGSAWSCLAGGGGGTPCTLTALSFQFNNGGSFGCVTDLTYSTHTITLGVAGILNITGTFEEGGAAGTSTQVLHGNTSGFSAVNLATDVTGINPFANGGTGAATQIAATNNLQCPNSGGGVNKGDTTVYSGTAGTGWNCFAGNNTGTQLYSQNSTGTPAWYPLQGTDTKVLTSGTISGTGAGLCTDALGGATTVGCSAGSGPGAPTFSTQINNGSGGFQGVGPGLTGQGYQAFNAAAPAWVSPGIPGSSVSTTPYIVRCDSAIALLDRLTTIEFFSGASVITMPDPTTSGCGSNFPVTLIDITGGTLTVNRTTTATFTVVNGFSVVTGATSFNLTNGQFAALSSPDNATWLVRLTNGGAGGTPAFPITVTGGVSGGIPCFTSTTNEAASALLTQFGVVYGGGAGVCPSATAQGGVNFPLIGQGASAPIFSTVGYPSSLTSGGILYASTATQLSSSGTLPSGDFVLGGGLGGSPTATFSVVPIANGGSGTGSTLTGLVRGSASAMTAAEISGDCTTSGSNAITCTKANGGAFPTSALIIGTNGSGQPVALPTITAIQGTDTKLLSSSSISASTGIVLCTDSVGGATTSGCPVFVANVTTTVGTSAIAANTCTAVTNLTMTGVSTAMIAEFTPTTDVSGVTGWGSTGGLVIDAWPSSANTMSYKVCNQTTSSITPSASVTFNVGAR